VQFFGIFRLAYYKSGIFYSDGPNLQEPRSTSADPAEVGFAKRKKAMFRNFKVLLLVLIVIVIAGSAYAFAAAITGITPDNAGEGVGTVNGYAATDVAYTLDGSDPTLINSVTFTLDSAATFAQIKLVTGGTPWYSCTNTLLVWTCNTTDPQATVATMTGLTIVAHNQAP
jgi:hypothetical protein